MRLKLLFLLLAILLIGIAIPVYLYSDKQALERSAADLENIVKGYAKPNFINYNTLGKYGPYVKALSEAYTKLSVDVQKLESKFAQSGFKEMLKPDYLKEPQAGKQHLKAAADSLAADHNLVKQDSQDFSKIVESSSLDPIRKLQIAKVAQDSIRDITQDQDRFFQLAGAIIAKADSMYDFLNSKRGSYTVSGNQVQFTTQQDADTYNKFIQDIQQTAKTLKK